MITWQLLLGSWLLVLAASSSIAFADGGSSIVSRAATAAAQTRILESKTSDGSDSSSDLNPDGTVASSSNLNPDGTIASTPEPPQGSSSTTSGSSSRNADDSDEEDPYDDYADEADEATAEEESATPHPTRRPTSAQSKRAETPRPTPRPTSGPTRAPTTKRGPTPAPTVDPDYKPAPSSILKAGVSSIPGQSTWHASATESATPRPTPFMPLSEKVVATIAPSPWAPNPAPQVPLMVAQAQTQTQTAVLPGTVQSSAARVGSSGASVMPEVAGSCDSSCRTGCSSCGSLCAACPACDPRQPGPFGLAQWCTPNISAQEDLQAETLVWTPAAEDPTANADVGGVELQVQGQCKLLCYEVWASDTVDFQTFVPFTLSGSTQWPMSSAGSDQLKFFKVRALEMSSSAVEVTHSAWSNVVERQFGPPPSTISTTLHGASANDTRTTTTTTMSAESTTFSGPVEYVPMWTPPADSGTAQFSGPQLAAKLDFVVPVDEIQDYANDGVVSQLGRAIAAMLDVRPDLVKLVSLSSAREPIVTADRRLLRRLRSTGVLRAGYRVRCSSEQQVMNLTAMQNNLGADQAARERFTNTLASNYGGQLTPVNPTSITVSDVSEYTAPPPTPAPTAGGSLVTKRSGWRESWLLFGFAALALLLFVVGLVCCCIPSSMRHVKIVERGAAPHGARGFAPHHFADLKKAALTAHQTAQSYVNGWGYSAVPDDNPFAHPHAMPAGQDLHYQFGFSHAPAPSAVAVPSAGSHQSGPSAPGDPSAGQVRPTALQPLPSTSQVPSKAPAATPPPPQAKVQTAPPPHVPVPSVAPKLNPAPPKSVPVPHAQVQTAPPSHVAVPSIAPKMHPPPPASVKSMPVPHVQVQSSPGHIASHSLRPEPKTFAPVHPSPAPKSLAGQHLAPESKTFASQSLRPEPKTFSPEMERAQSHGVQIR